MKNQRADNRRILIVLTGAYGNVGDGVIRRRILEWFRNLGPIHAYVGNAPDDWVEQLGLGEDDVVYRASDARKWGKLLLDKSAPAALVFDPGEVPLDKDAWRPETQFLLLSVLARLRRAVVVRPPRGIGNHHRFVLTLHKLGTRVSHVSLWRNERSLDIIGAGTLVPDTAFQEPRVAGVSWALRKNLIVSMRGKRSFPSDNWFQAITSIARSQDLTIQVVSQVREDERRSRELAVKLGAEYVAWGGRSDLEQETDLRRRYQEAAMVVSDRLHVLILACLAGAVPAEIADSPSRKVGEHFGQIGIDGLVFDTASRPFQSVEAFGDYICSRRDEYAKAIDAARAKLDMEELRIRKMVDPPLEP